MRGSSGVEGKRLSVEAAERKLRQFDFLQAAIDQVKRTSEPLQSLPWTAPISGTVIEKPAMAGMRFQASDLLYRLADLSIVWVMAELVERDLPLVKAGQRALLRLRSRKDVPIAGRVDFAYPDINVSTRTARVRIQLPNATSLSRSVSSPMPQSRLRRRTRALLPFRAAPSSTAVRAASPSSRADSLHSPASLPRPGASC